MGYYYSAFALYLRIDDTIGLIVGLIVVKALLLRWLFIARRRLEYEEIRRKKEAEVEQQGQEQKHRSQTLIGIAKNSSCPIKNVSPADWSAGHCPTILSAYAFPSVLPVAPIPTWWKT
jgi:small-conductance mechanosensitive channel